jgi:hypothetical protein
MERGKHRSLATVQHRDPDRTSTGCAAMMEAVGINGSGPGSKNRDSSSSSLLNMIKQFDIYTKVEEDYRVRTSHGAICNYPLSL